MQRPLDQDCLEPLRWYMFLFVIELVPSLDVFVCHRTSTFAGPDNFIGICDSSWLVKSLSEGFAHQSIWC